MKNQNITKFSIAFLMLFIFQINNLSAQMVGSNAYIKGTSVEIGINGNGGFEGVDTNASPPIIGMHTRTETVYFGFVANPLLDSWTNFDGDFFTPGTPENGWGLEVGITGGVSGNNNCEMANAGIPNQVPGTITNWSHIFSCYSCDWQGNITTGTNLHVKINYLLQETDLYYTTTVSITNNTGTVIPDMYYHRNLDPDNDETIGGSYTTLNTIVSEPGTGCNLAHVSATQTSPHSSYLGLAAIGDNWRAVYGGFSNRDASDLWYGSGATFPPFVQTVGASDLDDEAIALAYRIQNLAPGATETFKFVVILDAASATAAINNLLYLQYPGSLTAPPTACVPYSDSVKTCGSAVPIDLVGPIVSNYTWTWSPATGLSTTTGPSVIADPPTTTTYTVTGTPLTPCFAAFTATIVVEVTPYTGAAPVITPEPIICIGTAPFNLSVDSTGGVWGGPGITNPAAGTFDPATAGLGTHLITYVRPGICNNNDTTLITVVTAPNTTINPQIPVCVAASPVTLTAATGGGAWSGTGITSASGGTFDPTVSGAGSFVVTYTLSAGACISSDSATIVVFTEYNSTITPHLAVCAGSAPFNFTAATPGGTWSGTGITDTILGTFTPGTTGTYPIIYTLSGICASADTFNIVVQSFPDATFTLPPAVCAGSAPYTITAATSGGTWSGSGITSATAGTFNPSTAGTYPVTYTFTGACGTSTTQNITVNALPTPAFTSDVTSGCAPLCVHFNESGSTICANQLYTFGDGSTDSTGTPMHCYTIPGTYSVSISCTDANGCTGTTTIANMINVYQVPDANFTLTPTPPVTPNTTISFTDVSTGGGSPSWNFGDPSSASNTSVLSNPVHAYANEGHYCVTLVTVTSEGCVDTVKNCYEIISDGSIMIPNTFTPNGDGRNDVFFITCVNIAELHCTVYDRWGLKMSEWSDVNSGWNGLSFDGAKAPDGVYYYILTAKGNNGKSFQEQGYIQLLR